MIGVEDKLLIPGIRPCCEGSNQLLLCDLCSSVTPGDCASNTASLKANRKPLII